MAPSGSIVDVTQGHLAINILRLAWPSMMQAILSNAYSVADFFFVGHIKDPELAASGTSAIAASVGLTICLFGVHNIVPAGCAAYSAQFKGANDRTSLGLTFVAAFWSCLVLSSITAIFGLVLIGEIVSITNSTMQVQAEMQKFLGIILLASPAFGLLLLVDGFFKSNGNTVFPLQLEVCSLCINVLLNYFFVWRLGWGISGSACASALSRFLPALFGMYRILNGHLNAIEVKLLVYDPTLLSRALAMMRLGIFQSASDWLYGIVFTIMIRLAGVLGTAQQAGLGAGMRGLEWLSFCTSEGFMVASLTSVGNLIGAGLQRRANLAALLSGAMSALGGTLTGLPFIFWSHQIAALLSNDAEIVHFCARYIRLMGMVSFATGFEFSSFGAFIGAGKARDVFLTNGSCNIARVPLCVLCIFGRANFFRGLAFCFGLGSTHGLRLYGNFDCICWVIMFTAVIKAFLFFTWLNLRWFSERYFLDSTLLAVKAIVADAAEIQMRTLSQPEKHDQAYTSLPLSSDSEHG